MRRLMCAEGDELLLRVQTAVNQTVKDVMAAVNAARDGHLIDDSEVQANDLLNELKRKIFQEAIQTRIDATEASFSPSGPGDGSVSGEQRPRVGVASDAAGAGSDQPAAVRAARGGQRPSAG